VFRAGLAVVLALVGCDEDTSLPTGDVWNVFEMPEPLLETGAAALGTRLVLVGGITGDITMGLPITTHVTTFDTLTQELGSLPDLPVAWTHANVAAVGGVVYVLGGLAGPTFEPQGQVFVLELGANEWTELVDQPVPEPRGASAVVVSKGHIFLLGGAAMFETLRTNLDFDVATRTWTDTLKPPDLPTPRSHAAAIRRDDGTFVLAGGLSDLSFGMPLGDTYLLPPGATVWELAEPMPTPRGGCAYGAIYASLICAGGEAGDAALDVVELFNSFDNTWTELEPIPEPRAGARGTVVANRLYVPGGSPTLEFTPTNTLFELTPFVATD
jgi:N-acetylneuraminic acid mutarotase